MDKDLAIKIFEQWVCDYGCEHCPRKDDPLSNCLGCIGAAKGTLLKYIKDLEKENQKLRETLQTDKLMKAFMAEHNRNEKAIENAKEKIKWYESYIHDLKNGNYPSPTVRQERQELIFRIREQEDLINILKGDDENVK